jgi:excisionase family DNA binding protein
LTNSRPARTYDRVETDEIGGAVTRDRAELIRIAGESEWIRPGEAAVILGRHRGTIDNMMRDGRLPWARVGGSRLRSVRAAAVLRLLEVGDAVTGRAADHPQKDVPA